MGVTTLLVLACIPFVDCLLCGPGTYVKKNTSTQEESCEECPLGQYKNTTSDRTSCNYCWPKKSLSHASPYYKIISNCSATQNTIFECLNGLCEDHFFKNDPCRKCKVKGKVDLSSTQSPTHASTTSGQSRKCVTEDRKAKNTMSRPIIPGCGEGLYICNLDSITVLCVMEASDDVAIDTLVVVGIIIIVSGIILICFWLGKKKFCDVFISRFNFRFIKVKDKERRHRPNEDEDDTCNTDDERNGDNNNETESLKERFRETMV